MGIGFAAIRDNVSFLRYETKDNPLAPQERPRIRHALGFGISQSGRVLRDLVYLGFNEDLAGRQVFDGILPVMAGSRRTCVNWQFAQAAPMASCSAPATPACARGCCISIPRAISGRRAVRW